MNTTKRKCLECSSAFNALKAEVNRGRGIFCSKGCYWASKRVRENIACLQCGVVFEAKRCCNAKYCSTKCYGLASRIEKAPKEGRQDLFLPSLLKLGLDGSWGYGSRPYRIWRGMIARCKYPAMPNYKYYGARGITVCEDWRKNYIGFLSWALKSGYSDILTIDRINNNGNYEPSNCRWISYSEQHKNKRAYNTVP